jgi:urease subunit alpha
MLPAAGKRRLKKSDMPNDDACPEIRVDPRIFDVFADGVLATCAPATTVPLAHRHVLQ